MKKLIIASLVSSGICWMLPILMMVTGYYPKGVILVAMILLSLGLMFIPLICIGRMQQTGLDKDWFKTQEELQSTLEEANKSWNKAEKLCTIIGQHEAVKMWNVEKEKNEHSAHLFNSNRDTIS